MKTELQKTPSWCEHLGICQAVNCVDCPQKQWMSLTDADFEEILLKGDGCGLLVFLELIEKKLKEKNYD